MTYEDSVTPPIPEPAYLHLFDALPGNYLLLKTDEPYFTILAATSKRQEVVGVPKEAVIGKPLFEAHPGNLTDPTDDGVNNLRASLQHVIRFKEIHHLPVQRYDLPNEAGGFSEKYWEASNRPVFDELGEVAFIIHTAEDITDKVKAQKREVQMQGIERYAAALQQFKFMADNAPDPFILMRADGTFAYLNPKALEAWGYTEEEARHLLVKNVDPLYQDEKYAQLFAKAQKKTSLQIDTFHKRKDGHIYPVELNVNSLLLGNERHLFGVARNVTERRKAAEQLLSSHERIANILESTTDAFYALDNNFNFTYINAKAAQLWDRDREKLIGKNFWTEFSQAATSDSYLKHYEARNEAQPVHFEAISPILNTWIEASIYPGKDGSLSVFFHDITERKKSETALLESEAKFRTLFESMGPGFIVRWK